MNKNYMEETAKLLGVELEEEFKFKESTYDDIYYGYGKITKKGFMTRKEDTAIWSYNSWALQSLLTGTSKIEKLPWKPKKGEKYYTPSHDFDHAFCDHWDDYSLDFALKEAGMVFKTEKECETALPELRKKYLEDES